MNTITSPSQHILVVGGAGYIGSACVAALIERGYRVSVLDSLRTGQREKVHASATLYEGDILDAARLDEVFASASPIDAVIHFAALKAVGESEAFPELYYKNNVTGTINVLAAMAKHSVPTIIFSSTAAVYTPNETGIYTEENTLGSLSAYGNSKRAAEIIINDFARTKKIQNAVILRYFNVAGDAGLSFRERNPQNVFPLIGEALASGAPFNIFGNDYPTRDGTGVRDYIHVSDLVEAHICALRYGTSGTFNLGTSQGVTVGELVTAFEKASGTKLNVVVTPRRPGDPATVLADPSRAHTELKWQATHTLEDMVASTLSVYGRAVNGIKSLA